MNNQTNVVRFVKRWKDFEKENAGAQGFYIEFLQLFDADSLGVGRFEENVTTDKHPNGRIDFFWPGVLLAEHKSAGRNLDKAFEQAQAYVAGLATSGRDTEQPKYIMLSDFQNIRLYHRESRTEISFKLEALPEHIHHFDFIKTGITEAIKEEETLNKKAVALIGDLYDRLYAIEANQAKDLRYFMVRVLYCLFAEDTGIFEKNAFRTLIERSDDDGGMLTMLLEHLFNSLNHPSPHPDFQNFAYINGALFEDKAVIPSGFNREVRECLLECCGFKWGEIAPEIFGSLFQYVADAKKRRSLGEHYTREAIIKRTINPLFMDALRDDWRKEIIAIDGLSQRSAQRKRLRDFAERLSAIKIFDPACGCGNFLVVAYRELRRIETAVFKKMKALDEKGQVSFSLDNTQSLVNVDNFYGIEIEPFAVKVAQVALWLTDHQENQFLSKEIGYTHTRIPLTHSAKIVEGNALQIDWHDVADPKAIHYIVGNPPFVGSRMQNRDQKQEVRAIYYGVKGAGEVDYVACWHKKAADYIQDNKKIRFAFVSTNSITQGNQVAPIWRGLPDNIRICFAHRTFAWTSEVTAGMAAVHCVIVGMGVGAPDYPHLFEYPELKGEPEEITVNVGVNGYLLDAEIAIVEEREKPLTAVPEMFFGSMARDGGHLIIDTKEAYQALIAKEPKTKKWIKEFIGAEELIKGKHRYCLWLVGAEPNELFAMPSVMKRIKACKDMRENSVAASTRKMADTPHLFAQRAHPDTAQLVIPRVSSENRDYVPMAFVGADTIVSDAAQMIPDCPLWLFALLNSRMHMLWLDTVGGKLESRFRYSKNIVYNCFPFPELNKAQTDQLTALAQAILDQRAKHLNSTLANLYNATIMPADLRRAHRANDSAVEKLFLGKRKGFKNDAERLATLFGAYTKLASSKALALKSADDAKGKKRRRVVKKGGGK